MRNRGLSVWALIFIGSLITFVALSYGISSSKF